MMSLRSRLFRALLLVLVPIWLLLAVGSYWSVMVEVDEIYGQQLNELAMPLLPLSTEQIATNLSRVDEAGLNVDDDQEMAVLVWSRAGALRFRSANAPTIGFESRPASSATPSQTLKSHNVRWLVHWYSQPGQDRWLTVLRPLTERDELAVALGAGLASPSLLAVILMLPLGSWAIRQGLRPLQDVGRQVASRRSHDLSVIDDAHVAREVVPLVREINGLLGRLDVALTAEKRFTADASHELRTPLAATRAHIEVALGCHDDARREQALHQALAGLSQASELTEQLLLLARLDHEVTPAGPDVAQVDAPQWAAQVDLCELLRDLAAEHGVAALGKGVELSLDLPDQPCVVKGHPTWLGVAIGNVLSNAVKFTPAPGHIDVSLVQREDGVDIRVRDSGPGLAPGHMPLIGQRFFRGRHDLPGSGLGLSIVSRILALHGGTLSFASDEGLLVTLSLPLS